MANRIRSFLFTAIIPGLAAISFASRGFAQWSVLKSFGAPIRSVYFLDRQGFPDTGFVGLGNSQIWRTVDNGVTWTACPTPYYPSAMQITDFAFMNAQVGWCSVRTTSEVYGEIWVTQDGGASWSTLHTGGGFSSIGYYSPGTLVAPCWVSSSLESFDTGKTWINFAPAWQNGVTFSGKNAVVGNLSAPFPLVSNDGGATWNDITTLPVETWAPHAIVGTDTFVAAAEKTRQFFISTDGGATWANPYTFPKIAFPTGCIMGTAANLFVQTNTDGFYYSSDLGNTWTGVCGPNNGLDTRFYCKGKGVYAGDFYGNLWHTPDGSLIGGYASVLLDRTKLTFSGVRCLSYDTAIHFTYGGGCDSALLMSAQITSGSPQFSLAPASLPFTFSGMDSVTVIYSPSSALKDSGTLDLTFTLDTRTFDTVINLYGASTTKANYAIPGPTVISIPYACASIDTSLIVRNLSCDTLTIAGTTLNNNAIFKLASLKIPYKIPPLDSVVLTVSASSTRDGSFSATLKLILLDGANVINDSIPITFNVLHSGEAEVNALNITVPDACQFLDTNLTITNTKCDSITILSASLRDSSLFKVSSQAFPTVVQAGDGVTLPIHIQPSSKGTYTTVLDLRYVSGHSVIDTQITLYLTVKYDIPLTLNLPGDSINLGSASVSCVAATGWIKFRNTLCQNLTIKGISWTKSNNQFWFDSLALPLILTEENGVDSILVHFKPNSATTSSSQLRITLDLGGREVDTVITISGTGISSYDDTLLTPVLQYDTIEECRSLTRWCELVNLSCDSVAAISAVPKGAVGYSLFGGNLPQMIHSGDTLWVQFILQPTKTGVTDDSAVITLRDPTTGTNYIRTVALKAFVLPSSTSVSLNSAAFSPPPVPPCNTIDSFLTLSNPGCNAIVINSTSMSGGSAVQLAPAPALPLTVLADSSVRIPFQISPTTDSIEQSELSIKGLNIDTTIIFTYSTLPGGRKLSLMSVDSTFQTRPCQPVIKRFVLADTGCQDVLIDSITLAGLPNSTQFTIPNAPTIPALISAHDTLIWNVQFDPNGNGDDAATLGVYSRAGNFAKSFDLKGTVVGTVPTARIALQATNGTTQVSGYPAHTTSVTALLMDDIGDSTSLSTISFTLSTNWDLLTPLQFIPAAGWSVLDTSTSNGLFTIRIKHNVAGPVAAGTQLLQCIFYINVSDSTHCNIILNTTRFNNATANYESCVLASIPVSDPIAFTEFDTCSTPELRDALMNRLVLRIISIHPNPAAIEGGTAHLNVSFDLAESGNVLMIVRDAIGRECLRTSQPFHAGTHTVTLNLPEAAEGVCFVQLEAADHVAEASAVIQKLPSDPINGH